LAVDPILRIVVGLVLLGLVATGAIGSQVWVVVVPAVTGLFSFCPAYKILGINICGT
jgi:hypothetical protein